MEREMHRETARITPMLTALVDVPSDEGQEHSVINEMDIRIAYMRPRLASHPDTGLPFHCSICTPVSSPMSILCNNWAIDKTRFGRLNILTFRQPIHFPDKAARQMTMNMTKRMSIPTDKMAFELSVAQVTFLIMMGEVTISIFVVAPSTPTFITDRSISDMVLAEVKVYVRFMGCNVEVLQLSIPLLQDDNGIVILPFTSSFITPTTRIGGWQCHRFVVPLFITKWTEYLSTHRFHSYYSNPPLQEARQQ